MTHTAHEDQIFSPVTSGGDAAFKALGKEENTQSSIDTEQFLFVGAWVTLVGLSAGEYNGRSGTVINYSPGERVAVLLASTGERKSFKSGNLKPYQYDADNPELCSKCSSEINLFEFPPCDCAPDGVVEPL